MSKLQSFMNEGNDLHLYPSWREGQSLVFPLIHFSGYGSSEASEQEANAQKQSNPCLPANSSAQIAAKFLESVTTQPGLSLINEALVDLDMHLLQTIAEASQNDERLDNAITEYQFFQVTINRYLKRPDTVNQQYWALSLLAEARKKMAEACANGVNQTYTRCVTEYRPWQALRMANIAEIARNLGLSTELPGVFEESVIHEKYSRAFRFKLEMKSKVVVTAPKGGNDSTAVLVDDIKYTVESGSYNNFKPTEGPLYPSEWRLCSSENRVRPVYRDGLLKGTVLTITAISSTSSDPCKPIPVEPDDAVVKAEFGASDPVVEMDVLTVDGWKTLPTQLNWWNTFQMAHPEEWKNLMYFAPKEDKWEYMGGKEFAKYKFNGTPPTAAGGKGMVTEETEFRLIHDPEP